MQIKSNEFIILRLPPDEENIAFIYQTFGITQYIFFDDRFRTSHLIKENRKEMNIEFYNNFREKCLKIKEIEIAFTINEFIFLVKTIDFVAKCFIGEPKDKLEKILTADFESEDFDYDFKKIEEWYLAKSENLFQGFRDSCKNEKLLKQVSDELNWEIEI
jgi:hypothetical protein